MATESTFKGVWVGTQAQYDALASHDPNILYSVTDKNIPVPTASDAGKVPQVNSSGNYTLQPLNTRQEVTIQPSSWVNKVAAITVNGIIKQGDPGYRKQEVTVMWDDSDVLAAAKPIKYAATATNTLTITLDSSGTAPTAATVLIVIIRTV